MANTFIADCKAAYHQDQDAVQVIAMVADPETESSLHRALKTAKVELLFNNTVQDTIHFDFEAYVVPTEPHPSGEGLVVLDEDLGDFKLFFFHYPRSVELQVKLSVELTDGRKANALRPVMFERTSDDPVDWSNPVLEGRPDPNWKRKVILDYKRPQ